MTKGDAAVYAAKPPTHTLPEIRTRAATRSTVEIRRDDETGTRARAPLWTVHGVGVRQVIVGCHIGGLGLGFRVKFMA